MIFLIPLLFVIALIFGLDYYYFGEENRDLKEQKIQKNKKRTNFERDKEEYLKNLLKKNE